MSWDRAESAFLYLMFALAIAFATMGPPYHRLVQGGECGPEHHWIAVGVGPAADLSCEPD